MLRLSDSVCCDEMRRQLRRRCPEHPDLATCPDALVGRFGRARTIGLYVHDGGPSYVRIRYCPWCGTRLAVPDAAREASDARI
jgi:hypothetical protein